MITYVEKHIVRTQYRRGIIDELNLHIKRRTVEEGHQCLAVQFLSETHDGDRDSFNWISTYLLTWRMTEL